MLEIPQAVSVPWSLRRVVVLEGFLQPMPVVGATVGALGPVGHDDVRVTVGLVTAPAVRMLDHLDQPVDMRIRAKIMPVDVLVIVPVRHRAMLPVDAAQTRRRPARSSRINRVDARTSSGRAWAIASSIEQGSTTVASSPSKSSRSSVSSATLPPMATTGMPACRARLATAAPAGPGGGGVGARGACWLVSLPVGAPPAGGTPPRRHPRRPRGGGRGAFSGGGGAPRPRRPPGPPAVGAPPADPDDAVARARV